MKKIDTQMHEITYKPGIIGYLASYITSSR